MGEMMKLGPYILGPTNDEHQGIYTGDARELAQAIPDESVDLVLTDPPFGIGYQYSHDYKDSPKGYLDLVRWIVRESQRIIKPGGLCFIFQAMPRLRETWPIFPDDSRLFAACKNFTQYRPIAVQFGFDPVVFWQKQGQALIETMAGRRDWHIGNTAFYISQKVDFSHACPRPLDTIIYMADNFCPPNGIILDWFLGSGTTAVAAKLIGRKYWGCEIDPKIAQLARDRIRRTQPPLFVPEFEQTRLVL